MCKALSSDYARHLANWHQRTATSLYEALCPAFGWTAAPFCYPRLGIWVPSSRVFNWKLLCTVQLCAGLNRKGDTQNSQSPQKHTRSETATTEKGKRDSIRLGWWCRIEAMHWLWHPAPVTPGKQWTLRDHIHLSRGQGCENAWWSTFAA